ncbi:MAG: hypothetical protein GC202_14430 [Alphaproteobacteria bacterium]|nr:hypothetical protein [Alphaproteobacteria bacterium]
MEISALEQLLRGDQSGGSARRPSNFSAGTQFSSLLDAQSARVRSQPVSYHPAEVQNREGSPTLKTVARPERKDDTRTAAADQQRRKAESRADSAKAKDNDDDRSRDVRNDDDRTKVSDRSAAGDDDSAASTADAAATPRKDKVVAKGDGARKTVAKDEQGPAKDGAPVADAKPAEPASATPAGATADATTPDDADNKNLPDTAQPVVVLDPAVATPLATVVPTELKAEPVHLSAADITKGDGDDEAAVDGGADKAAKTAAPANAKAAEVVPVAETKDPKAAKPAELQIALPTSTLAGAEKKAAPATEEFADFMLRNAAGTHAAAGAEAAKDQVKADTDANDPHIVVTVAQPVGTTPAAAPVAPVTAFAVQAAVSNDNVALEAVKAAGANAAAEGDEPKAAAKDPAPANAAFAQALNAARSADAPDAPKAAQRAPVVPPHEQVAFNIRKAVSEGLDQISIRLNPAELGRIDVKLDVSSDGTLRASFAAEKHHTLELLKNDSRQLESSLTQAGFKADAGGLNFSLRGDNGGNAQAFRESAGQNQTRSNRSDDAKDTAPVAPASYPRRRAANGSVDLNA